MGYKVIFLDGLDGRPFVECEVCRRIERNVIEPVAIFVEEEDFESIDRQLKNLPKDKIDELIGKLIKETNKLLGQSESRCIFHCEKENEVWIENIEEYREYRQRQKEAIEKKQSFYGSSPAKWRENLVDIFWERIRVYRFAVDYADELTDEARKILEENEEIKRNKNLLKFFLEKCKEKKCYDFRNLIFPNFQKEIYEGKFKNVEFIEKKNDNKTKYHSKYLENLNFWYRSETKKFKNNAYFRYAQFSGEAEFGYAQFSGEADFCEAQFSGEWANFREAQFSGEAYFGEAKFSGEAYFFGAQFSGEADFRYAQFSGEWADFREAQFSGEAYFGEAKFLGKANFGEARFTGDANFGGAQFSGEWANFGKAQFSGEADFCEAQFSGKAYFSKAQFSGEADFGYAQFSGEAYFGEAKFSGEADFWEAQFSGEADFEGARFEKKTFFYFNDKNKSINFSSIQCSPDTHIEIRNLKTERLIIKNFTNYAKEFLFFDLELLPGENNNKPNLEIKNSILNKMRFINCDFSKGEKIKIEDSSIASCEFVNVKWGKITERRICPELFEKEPSKAQDIYRQLKLAHDNQKDFIHGGDFYALEMRAYDKYLDNLSWREHFKDKLVFKISKIASNYTQDWWLSLKWILFIILMLTFFRVTDYSYVFAQIHKTSSQCLLTFTGNFVYFTPMVFILYLIVKLIFYFLLTKNLSETFKKLNINYFLIIPMLLFLIDSFLFNSNKALNMCKCLFKKSFEAIELYLQTFAQTITPWKSLLNETSSVHSVLYKIVFTFSVIAISYLAYQLIVSLRRKIRR